LCKACSLVNYFVLLETLQLPRGWMSFEFYGKFVAAREESRAQKQVTYAEGF
jgi:hypothetical protein